MDITSTPQIDPKLLAKALLKMQGLVRGHGVDVEKVILDRSSIEMARFKARIAVKLEAQYGVKTEAGRNTTAELMPSEADFRNALTQIAIDVRTNPQRRKLVADFIVAKPNKGFGIRDQKTKFHMLSRNFVQHQKCQTCQNVGKTKCTKCGGDGIVVCNKCFGKRHVKCSKCFGDGKLKTQQGTKPCNFCKADGRISCSKCQARGQMKCQNCAATGQIACRPCAGSGWMSHLAHVEVMAHIHFDFEKENLPPALIQAIEYHATHCIDKHDIEVAQAKGWAVADTVYPTTQSTPTTEKLSEPDDTLWLDYDALCPFGTVDFTLGDKKVSGNLFGFQARLMDFPHFLDELTATGQTALLEIPKLTSRHIPVKIKRAAKYPFLREIITQTFYLQDNLKAKAIIKAKYQTGFNEKNLEKLIAVTDLALRRITRKWRIIGLIIGMILFALLVENYFLEGGRLSLKEMGLPEIALAGFDFLFIPLGIVMGIYAGKLIAIWAQNRILRGIVPTEILTRTLPKSGKIKYWAIGLSVLVVLGGLCGAVFGGYPLPNWVEFITSKLHATIL